MWMLYVCGGGGEGEEEGEALFTPQALTVDKLCLGLRRYVDVLA